MRVHRSLLFSVAAAGIGLAGLAFFAVAADQMDQPMQQGQAGALNLPQGITSKQLNAAGPRDAVAKVTEHAVTKGAFEKLASDLTSQDEKRIKEFKDADTTKLDGRIAQIQKAWKAKYGTDFDLDKVRVVFNDSFGVATGEVSDPTVAMTHWPVPCTKTEAVTAGAMNPGQNQNDADIDKGREVALFRFPEGNSLPEITVSLVKQGIDHWVVDLPKDRTGQQLYNDLLTHLTFIGEHEDAWPADINDAYRLVAQHTFAALYGVNMTPRI